MAPARGRSYTMGAGKDRTRGFYATSLHSKEKESDPALAER